jgi:hypothetical protein
MSRFICLSLDSVVALRATLRRRPFSLSAYLIDDSSAAARSIAAS